MSKRHLFISVVYAIFTVMCFAGSAFAAAPSLFLQHITSVDMIDGKPSYTGQSPSLESIYMEFEDTDQQNLGVNGTLTLKNGTYAYGSWQGGKWTILGTVMAQDKDFTLWSAEDGGYYYHYPSDASGNLYEFAGSAETGLSTKDFSYSIGSFSGNGKLPVIHSISEQMRAFVPYIEPVKNGGNVTGLVWRFVKPSNTSTALTNDASVGIDRIRRIRVVTKNGSWEDVVVNKSLVSGVTLSGNETMQAAIPERNVVRYEITYYRHDSDGTESYIRYDWRFRPTISSGTTPTPTPPSSSSSSSGCNTGFASGLLLLAGVALLKKR